MTNKTYLLITIVVATLIKSSWAAELNQAEPGEIVIMRAVTPQPVNRIDQQGPIISKVDLKPPMLIEDKLDGPLGSITAISITDEQAASVHGNTTPGKLLEESLASDSSSISDHKLYGAANGYDMSRANDMTGRLTQILGSASNGGGTSAATNNAMKGLADTLGQAFRPMAR